MKIDYAFVNDDLEFIAFRLGGLGVGSSFRIFIHNNALFAGRINLKTQQSKAADIQKYAEFDGSADEFLALNNKNFVIYGINIREIHIDLMKSKKIPFPNNGTMEIRLQNGKKVTLILTGVNVPAFVQALKGLTAEIYLTKGKVVAGTIDMLSDDCCCTGCGTSVKPQDSLYIPPEGKDEEALLCFECTQQLDEMYSAEAEDVNIGKAIIFGVLMSVIAVLLWFGVTVLTGYQIGWAGVGIGWLIATAVMRGAGNRRGPSLQRISLVFAVFAMMFSQYFIERHYAIIELGLVGVPVLLPLGTIVEVISYSIQADPITLLFWGIAAFYAYKLPARRKVPEVLVNQHS